jgi:hypothetical protein
VYQKNKFTRAAFLTTLQERQAFGGCVSAMDANGRTIRIADAHRGDGKRFIVHADEKLTAFMELETAIRAAD